MTVAPMTHSEKQHHIALQFERLRRNYDRALQSSDEIALLDLSHSLRVCAEMRPQVEVAYPRFLSTNEFESAIPAKKAMRAARGAPYMFAYMPSGVITYAANGEIFSGPGSENLTAGSVFRSMPRGGREMRNFYAASTDMFKKLLPEVVNATDITRGNFGAWLGSDAARVCYADDAGTLKKSTISKELMIKRVANTLGASHSTVAQAPGEVNVFDAPIHYLLSFKLGGLQLPYFILMKIAQDLLALAPTLMDNHNAA